MCRKESWGASAAPKKTHSTQRGQQPRMHGPVLAYSVVHAYFEKDIVVYLYVYVVYIYKWYIYTIYIPNMPFPVVARLKFIGTCVGAVYSI